MTDSRKDERPHVASAGEKQASDATSRVRTYVNLVSAAAIVGSLLVLIRALPVDRAMAALQAVVVDMGPWGGAVYGVAYALGALLFVPGAALTLGSGVLFGPLWGTVIVSISSTISAAIAFLIARYVARDAVARSAGKYPKFAAIDEAIGSGGWKIIAMLRLSPAVPFSLGNYLYGLTAVRFWPYVLASWLFMLPGTFLYIYLGHAGKVGLAAAASGPSTKSPAQWTLLVVGLLATVVVTVYVTKLARRSIRQHTRIDAGDGSNAVAPQSTEVAAGKPRGGFGRIMVPAMAIVMVGGAACASTYRTTLRNLFGPPPVTLQEAYADAPSTATFDHSAFDALLHEHVDADGWVDYAGLLKDASRLDAYIATLADAPFGKLDRNGRLALLINAYNAFTLRLILDHYPIKSIKDIPDAERWDAKRWRLAGNTWSLNQIEHEQIRPKFAEPRVHFALVCAAIGCPKLRNEAYKPDRIDEQLGDQSRYVHAHPRWFVFDAVANRVRLSKLYKWYGSDFKQRAGSVLKFAARYSSALKQALDAGGEPKTAWLDYDWKLNDQTNRP